MPVDAGVRDAYLTTLRKELEQLRGERDQFRTLIDTAVLRQQAAATLTEAQQHLLADVLAGVPPAELRAEAHRLKERFEALQALELAVKAAA